MTRTVSVLAAGSEFDDFLYASIGVENNGMLLSVLSALARLNVDPWEEAARLARLPREAASRFLANLIAAQPAGSSQRADPETEALRLIALLPQRVAAPSNPEAPSTGPISTRPRLIRHLIYYILLTLIFFGSQWILERSREGTRSSTKLAPASAPTVAPATATPR
jgi:hypothetical protein